jgi:hypothetical protein
LNCGYLLQIHEQYFILSWSYHKIFKSEWYKKAKNSLFTLE